MSAELLGSGGTVVPTLCTHCDSVGAALIEHGTLLKLDLERLAVGT